MAKPSSRMRLRKILAESARRSLYLSARAAGAPVTALTRKSQLLDSLAALSPAKLARALADGMPRRDLEALCETIGYSTAGSSPALAGRILAAAEDPAARVSRWRPFDEARSFAQSLQLTSQREWWEFARSGRLPADIPKAVYLTYGSDWTSWGDFLGTGNPARHLIAYRPFEKARAYVRSLGLKGVDEWRAYYKKKSGNRRLVPPDIPLVGHKVYAGKGWVSYGDWLGTGRIAAAKRVWRSYEESKRFVRSLGIRSEPEWQAYCRGDLFPHRPRPDDVPAYLARVYKDRGWKSWGDFTGSGSIAATRKKFRSFHSARAYVRRLSLRDNKQWRAWSRSGKRPNDIPSSPDAIYEDQGWISWGDFLGTGSVHPGRRRRPTFAAARGFVHRLGLRTRTEYERAWHEGKIPPEIPFTIGNDPEWQGWADFLGKSYRGRERRLRS